MRDPPPLRARLLVVPVARRRSLLLPLTCIALFFAGGVVSGLWWRSARGGAARPTSFRDVVAGSKPAVVGVHAILPPGSLAGARDGSGFIIHPDGLVLTNAHLVADPLLVLVEVPDRGRFVGQVVSIDPVTDIAVLRLEDPPEAPLPALAFADSDEVHEGDWVVTLGHPFALRHTVTAGLVSHRGRHFPVHDSPISAAYLQFSAAVNPGSSGGPVLDGDGRVVGITTSKWLDGEGLAFAVPSNVVRWVLARMESHGGQVPRGYLGVSLAPGRADGAGAQVTAVDPDGPGWRAGIRAGDVVVRFAGQDVEGAEELYEKITQALPATEVDVEVKSRERPGARRLVAVLGSAPLEERTPAETGTDPPRPRTQGSEGAG